MTTRFLDSFDHYALREQKWTGIALGTGGSFTIGAGARRTGINGMAIVHSTYSGTYTAFVPNLPAKVTYIFGFAFQPTLFPIGTRECALAFTMDGGAFQGSLGIDIAAHLVLYRGSMKGTQVAASSKSLILNTWYYVEFKHTVDNLAGVLEVRVNGEVWATFAGNTRSTGVSQITALGFGGETWSNATGNKPTWNVDDIYVNDTDGAAPNNTYWGDTQVEARVPSGNSPTYQEWPTLVGAASHWQAVSEIPPNEDTSYVASTTVGERDLYTRPAIAPAAATINALQVNTRARKDVAGAASFARMYRRAATDDQGADTALSTSHAYYFEMMETDPIAVGVWTVANVNAAEFGVRTR